ncbi:MAG: DUF1917 domain-containing protein [Anaerolineae bacterium]|nr:DUF1917 domain-containing protein [Anaerolineae bacterium]
MSDDKLDPQKLDLIQLVQRARMANDEDAKPSEVNIGYWIEAKRKGDGAQPTPRTGQWVIRTNLEDIDAMWERIKTATEAGKLGYKSKAASVSRMGKNASGRMICVRTYDADDQADVERVLNALREIGIEGKLRYERDVEA